MIFHMLFQGVGISDYNPDVGSIVESRVSSLLADNQPEVNVLDIREGSVILLLSADFTRISLEMVDVQLRRFSAALHDQIALKEAFGNATGDFFKKFTTLEVHDIEILHPPPPPPMNNPLVLWSLSGMCMVFLIAAMKGLIAKCDCNTWSEFKAGMKQHGRLMFGLFMGIFDFYTDVLFADIASHYENAQAYYLCSVLFLCVPLFVSAFITLMILMSKREQLHANSMAKNGMLYAIIMILAASNLEMLTFLPWKETSYSGFPDARMVQMTYITVVFEDIPQFIIQLLFTMKTFGEGVPVQTLLSIGLSASSILLRVMTRLIGMLFVEEEDGAGADERAHIEMQQPAKANEESLRRRRLRELKSWHDEGLIDDDEFASRKKSIFRSASMAMQECGDATMVVNPISTCKE